MVGTLAALAVLLAHSSVGIHVFIASFSDIVEILADSSKHPEMTVEGIAFFLHQFLSTDILSNLEKFEVCSAARHRYEYTSLPYEISSIIDLFEQEKGGRTRRGGKGEPSSGDRNRLD
jgi:hypothetical protein